MLNMYHSQSTYDTDKGRGDEFLATRSLSGGAARMVCGVSENCIDVLPCISTP